MNGPSERAGDVPPPPARFRTPLQVADQRYFYNRSTDIAHVERAPKSIMATMAAASSAASGSGTAFAIDEPLPFSMPKFDRHYSGRGRRRGKLGA